MNLQKICYRHTMNTKRGRTRFDLKVSHWKLSARLIMKSLSFCLIYEIELYVQFNFIIVVLCLYFGTRQLLVLLSVCVVCLSVCPFKRLMNMNIDHDFLFFHNFVIIQSVLSVSLANHMLIIWCTLGLCQLPISWREMGSFEINDSTIRGRPRVFYSLLRNLCSQNISGLG